VPNRRPLVAIVDDDPSIRAATHNLLDAAGFATASYDSPQAFLQSPMRGRTSCLVVDFRMPGMTGLALYLQLLASGDTIPTVLVTAYQDDAVRDEARRVGISCYLGKPFAPEELCECVRKAIASRATPSS
jgi:FixJ family two-component response regulator